MVALTRYRVSPYLHWKLNFTALNKKIVCVGMLVSEKDMVLPL